jgi:hypothetical protein
VSALYVLAGFSAVIAAVVICAAHGIRTEQAVRRHEDRGRS